ncbi:MAG: protein-glutamate O-methyltransferase CheR [Candidatus Riflebacteria bacterium]|nr:protein-glutamate O-methyltransferase CheR [Candidatus Riflebacteria bacterium]
MKLTNQEFEKIRSLLHDKFGISLADHKMAMVTGRLRKIIMQKGFSSFSEFIDSVQEDGSGRELQVLIDRMSTNHTFFFREKQHFDFFSSHILPEITHSLDKKGSGDLRIWCAAASTGEEPYSIMMTMLEFFKDRYRGLTAGLLATDISSRVLEDACAGIYEDSKTKGIPENLRKRYLQPAGNDSWQFKEFVRKEIIFRKFNLMNPFPFKKQFNVIFCRNVMIYFDTATRKELIKRLYQATAPGGYLLVGHSESIRSSDCPYDYVQPAIFRKGESG